HTPLPPPPPPPPPFPYTTLFRSPPANPPLTRPPPPPKLRPLTLRPPTSRQHSRRLLPQSKTNKPSGGSSDRSFPARCPSISPPDDDRKHSSNCSLRDTESFFVKDSLLDLNNTPKRYAPKACMFPWGNFW